MNVDDRLVLERLVTALGVVALEDPLVFPAHPRTRQRLTGLLPAGIAVVDPVGYLEFIAVEAGARLVPTDSGGVQEETTVLGVPCLKVRDNTERPITIAQGTNQLVGCEPERIIAAARAVPRDGVERRRPALWDGQAGKRIAGVLLYGGLAESRLRPTDSPPLEYQAICRHR